MATFLRLLVLALFASAGVGLAIAFAKHTERNPLPMAKGSTSKNADSLGPTVLTPRRDSQGDTRRRLTDTRSVDNPAENKRALATSEDTQLPSVPAAHHRPYEPAVASQAAALQQSLNIIQQTLNKQGAEQSALPPPNTIQVPPAAAEEDPTRVGEAASQEETQGVPQTLIRGEGDDSLEINLKNSDIREVLQLLSQQGQLNILASPSVTGTVSASLVNVSVRDALDAILKSTGFSQRAEGSMIYVGTPEDLMRIDHFREPIETRVFRPNYVRAEELQRLITPLLTQAVGQAAVNSATPTAGGNANGGISRLATSTPAGRGIEANTTDAGGDDFAGGDVLLVRDYASVLTRIEELVRKIDRRPLQVSIEAMILSVKLDDSNERGVNFEILRDQSNARLISGSPLPSLANINLADGGLKLGFLDQSLSTFVNALETVGDTNVVAAPRLLVMNKQRAEILIGSELGYVSTTVTESAATQSVEFLEVGTQLRIRPYISSDGMVRLEVHPELSTGSVRVEQGFTLPDKEVTQVTTNVLCPDACTVVIGGLIREDLITTTSQIPLLGNIPLFGGLFRQKKEETDKREIIVLLTPRIMFNEQLCREGSDVANTFLERQSIYSDKMDRLGKRHYGRRYLRMARAAIAAGDTQAAFRFINLAIHFDPLNAEATEFRRAMTASGEARDHSVRGYLREGLPAWQRPTDYSARGFPWQDPPRFQPAIPNFPEARFDTTPPTVQGEQIQPARQGERSR